MFLHSVVVKEQKLLLTIRTNVVLVICSCFPDVVQINHPFSLQISYPCKYFNLILLLKMFNFSINATESSAIKMLCAFK